MTAPERPDVQRVREWSGALAATLDEAAARVADIVRGLEQGWPDARGAEWTERLLLLRRALERDADAAADFGRAIDRVADASYHGSDDGPVAPPLGGSGPRLGGTGARRADDDRGVRIPRLNDPADGGE